MNEEAESCIPAQHGYNFLDDGIKITDINCSTVEDAQKKTQGRTCPHSFHINQEPLLLLLLTEAPPGRAAQGRGCCFLCLPEGQVTSWLLCPQAWEQPASVQGWICRFWLTNEPGARGGVRTAHLRSISGSPDTDLPAEAEGTITPQAKGCGAVSWHRVGRRARGARGTSEQPPLHHSSLHSPLLCRKDTLAAGPRPRKAWHKPRRAEGGLPPMHSFINPLPHPVTTFPETAWMKETSSARLGDVAPRAHCGDRQHRALKHTAVQPKGGSTPKALGWTGSRRLQAVTCPRAQLPYP